MSDYLARADGRLGRLRPDGGVEYVRHLRHGPERVWQALTESEHLVHWFPADVVGERRAGAELELPFWPAQVERYGIEDPVTYGELVTWEPPRLWEWTWAGDRLRWELEPEGDGGTLLTFTTWLANSGAQGLANAGSGYHLCLDQLEDLLDEGSVGYLEDATIRGMQEKYAALS